MLPATPPPDALRRDDDRALVWRALTLGERLAQGTPPADRGSTSTERRLDLWCKACAAGDQESFLRRLSWDGWAPTSLAPCLDDDLPSADFEPLAPTWIGTLSQVRRELAEIASELCSRPRTPFAGPSGPRVTPRAYTERQPEESLFADGKAAPFLEIWVAFLRVARRSLRSQAGSASTRLRAEALGTLERQLLLDLSGLGVHVLFDRFDEYRKQAHGPRSSSLGRRHLYRKFLDWLLERGLEEIFQEYSVLARQACAAVESWVGATVELLHRLDRDADAIAVRFNGGLPISRVRALRPGLSDRHRGGRQVAELIFESGLRLIYKPRSVRLESAVHGFMDWLAEKGLGCAPPTLTFLCRGDYGWVECAQPVRGQGTDLENAEDYLRRAGSLLCIADVLRIDDIHWENLVATLRGPALVDCEMALQPQVSGAPPRSILTSQLLTSFQIDAAGRPFETGALRSAGGQVQEEGRRVWKNVNTDSMGYETRRPIAKPGANVTRRNGDILRPEGEPEAFLGGYEETYRFLLEHRGEILRENGPLAAFEGCSTRILFRPTQVYSVLQSRLGAPSYLKSGAVASLLVDSLNRVFTGHQERPLLWPLTHEERHALERRDVPTFSVGVEADSLTTAAGFSSEETPVGERFEASGLQAVKLRLAALGKDDRRSQSQLLRRLSRQPPRFQMPPAALLPADEATLEGRPSATEKTELLRHAEAIGQRVLRQEPPSFHHLYDGGCGTAVFLAALAARLGDETYRRRALGALEALGSELEEGRLGGEALGACHGLGGIIYGLVLTHRLLKEPRCLAWASTAASLITEQRVAADRRLDLEGGAAGAIVGLLALYDATGDATLLNRAEVCAEHLLAHPAAQSDNACLNIPAGLAHGASGFALALARLAARSAGRFAGQQERYGGWALRLFAHEGQLLATRRGTDGRWCNGAAGMALARLDAISQLGADAGSDLETSLEVAVQATVSCLATTRDDLCCGRLGRADAILEIGRQLQDPWLLRTAGLATGAVLEDARETEAKETGAKETGSFRLALLKDAAAPIETQLFSGLSGVGYSLLRRVDPEAFPCLLLFRS